MTPADQHALREALARTEAERDAAVKDRDQWQTAWQWQNESAISQGVKLAAAEAERDAAEAGLAQATANIEKLHSALSGAALVLKARDLAAEAENTRLKETVEAAATRFEDIAAGRAFQPRLHAATGATEARSVLATIPPKENLDA